MTPRSARQAAIDEALSGLAQLEVAPELADAIRTRMHHQLVRNTSRRVRKGTLTRLPHRMAAQAAVVAALVLLYLSGVVRQALAFYGL